jgi:hypothetical protein
VFPDLDELRHALGLIVLVTVPIDLGVWLLIHPLARTWRRVGPVGSYAALTVPSLAVALVEPPHAARRRPRPASRARRDRRRGVRGGDRDRARAPAAAHVAHPRRRPGAIARQGPAPHGGHLRQDAESPLPRVPAVRAGFVAIANHAGTWLLWALCFPGIHLVVLLEERELRDRFGAEYDAYCRRVARYLPPLGS